MQTSFTLAPQLIDERISAVSLKPIFIFKSLHFSDRI